LIHKVTKAEAKQIKNKHNPLGDLIDEVENINLDKEIDKILDETFVFDADEITDKIMKFGSLLADTKLYSYQENVARTLIKSIVTSEGERVTILFPRQSGKTEIFKVVVPACAVLLPRLYNLYPEELEPFRNGFMAGVFALSKETSITMFKRIQDVFRSSHGKFYLKDPELDIKVRKTNPIELSNGSLVRAHSMLAKILVSYSYHLMIIDEADKALNTHRLTTDIQPMGTAYNGTFTMLGTAGDTPCLFYNYITSNKEVQNDGGKKNHFQIHWKQAAKINKNYAKAMIKILEDLRVGNITQKSFDMSYKLNWLIDDNRFISDYKFNSLCDKSKETGIIYDYANKEYMREYSLVAGLDLAKKVDRSVLTILRLEPIKYTDRYNKRIVSWFELEKIRWSEQRRKLFEIITRFPLDKLFIDATGVGEVFCDDIEEDLEDWKNIEITHFVFSLQSKSEGYANLEDIIDREELIIPASIKTKTNEKWIHFRQDCRSGQKVVKGEKNYMVVEAMSPLHDDYLDSLMLANLAADELREYGKASVRHDMWG
jgi:hypothetical protein